jgi:hypothetical protein
LLDDRTGLISILASSFGFNGSWLSEGSVNLDAALLGSLKWDHAQESIWCG